MSKEMMLQITGKSRRILIVGNIVMLPPLAGDAAGPIKVSDLRTIVKISQAREELISIIAINGI